MEDWPPRYGGFHKWGTPSHHPFLWVPLFSPSIGVSPMTVETSTWPLQSLQSMGKLWENTLAVGPKSGGPIPQENGSGQAHQQETTSKNIAEDSLKQPSKLRESWLGKQSQILWIPKSDLYLLNGIPSDHVRYILPRLDSKPPLAKCKKRLHESPIWVIDGTSWYLYKSQVSIAADLKHFVLITSPPSPSSRGAVAVRPFARPSRILAPGGSCSSSKSSIFRVSQNMAPYPKIVGLEGKIPLKLMILGVPLFHETSILGSMVPSRWSPKKGGKKHAWSPLLLRASPKLLQPEAQPSPDFFLTGTVRERLARM